MSRVGAPEDYGFRFTTLSKNLLVSLVVLYVLQIVLENWMHVPVMQTLAWWDFRAPEFRVWQPLTWVLVNGSPMEAFFDWLAIFFFVPPIEGMYGTRGFLRAMLTTAVIAVAGVAALIAMGAVTAVVPYYGLNPFLTALLVLFGLSRPHMRILVVFVLPVPAGVVAWITGLLAFLYFLFLRDLHSAMWLLGWVGGWAWLQLQLPGGVRRPWLKVQHWMTEQKLKRFEVLEGGAEDPEDKVRPLRRPGSDDDLVH